MQIHVTRNGQKYGPYILDEVNRQLATGDLNASDLAWYQGLETWVPLATVKGVIVSAHPPPPPRPLPANTKLVNYQDYNIVPWYRRSGTNSLFLVVNLFTFIPLTLSVCYMLVTGEIYYNKKDGQGNLKTWSKGNKVVAYIILLVNAFFLLKMLA